MEILTVLKSIIEIYNTPWHCRIYNFTRENGTVVHSRFTIGSLTGALVQKARGRIDNKKEKKKRYAVRPRTL